MRLIYNRVYDKLRCGKLSMDNSSINRNPRLPSSSGNIHFGPAYVKEWPKSVHLMACGTGLYLVRPCD